MLRGYNSVCSAPIEQKDEPKAEGTGFSGSRVGRRGLCCYCRGQKRPKVSGARVE